MDEQNAAGRPAALQAMAEKPLDVLVIGGGVTGAGVALDAAARGYRVGLVERGDFASGTSSWSTKLVHGGIRYLPEFDIALVREALIERRATAPQRVPSRASARIHFAALRQFAPSRRDSHCAAIWHWPRFHPGCWPLGL